MSTITGVDALARIKELQAEADQVQQDADEKLGKIFAEMRDVSNAASGAYQIHDGNGKSSPAPAATATATAPAKKRGRPKKTAAAPAAKKRGRPKKDTAAPAAKKRGRPKKDTSGKNYDNPTPLREVIWEIMSRSAKKWKEHLPDLPSGVTGLKAVEIATIIESEGSWSSSSASSVATQISKHIKDFREAGKMTRGEQARYEIVKGAKLND